MIRSDIKKILLAAAILVIAASGVFAQVQVPLSGTATPNGKFVFIPDGTRQRIRVCAADSAVGAVSITADATAGNVNDAAIKQNMATTGFKPAGMAVDAAGANLYVTMCQTGAPYYSFVNKYSIRASDGWLTYVASVEIHDKYSSPRGCVINPAGTYLYVADSGNMSNVRKIRKINLATFTEGTAITVSGSNMILHGIAISHNGKYLFVSVNRSDIGQVLVYDITNENSPQYQTSISNCPAATTLKVSPDDTMLFVKVNEPASPYVDVRVFSIPGWLSITDLVTPNPGNGYDTYNDNAGLDIDPNGYLYYTHYVSFESNNGMWYWNLKIRVNEIANLSNSWESNGGVGLHSADSIVFTGRRIWTMYSDGGCLQSPPGLGPTWVSNGLVISNEATVIWSTVEGIDHYEIQYMKHGDVSSVATATATAADISKKLTGLTPMTDYDVRIRTVSSLGDVSQWTPNLYNPAHGFYTLEPVWVNHYNLASNEATIIFGPLVSTSVMNVPNAVSYEVSYKFHDPLVTAWTTVRITSPYKDNGKNYIYRLTGLSASKFYDVRMRSVDQNGRSSDWSATDIFYTLESMWVSHYAVTSNEATMIFGPVISKKAMHVPNADHYDLQYRVKGAPNWTDQIVASPANNGTNEIYALTNLTPSTTYEARMMAVDSSNGTSEWSATDTFYTLEKPWVSHAKVIYVGQKGYCSFYVLWGPDTTKGLLDIPNAVSYECISKKKSDANWGPSVMLRRGRKDSLAFTTLNYSQTGEAPTASYYFRIRAIDAKGLASDWSTTDEVFMLERPWVGSIHTTDMDTTIIWGPETTKNVLDVPNAMGYQFRYRIQGSTDWPPENVINLGMGRKDDTTVDVLNFHLQDLTADTTYEAQMRCMHMYGSSDWSETAVFTTIRGPWWLDVTVTGTREAHIFWDTPEAQSYELRYSKLASAEGGTDVITTDAFLNATGLDSYTTYYAKVRSITPNGASDWTTIKHFYTMPYPGWITSYSTDTTSTTLTWQGVSIPEGVNYIVSYGKSPTSDTSNDSPVPSDQNSMQLKGLIPRTWYRVKVMTMTFDLRGYPLHYSEFSPTHDFFTIPGPNNVRCNATTPTTASITWEPVDMGGTMCTSYEVSWGLTSEDAVGSGDAVTSEVHYTIAGLTTFQRYYVQVRARDDANKGYSDWVPVPSLPIVPGNPPTPVWVNHYMVTSHEAIVDWASVEAIDKYVFEYKRAIDPTWTSFEVATDHRDNTADNNPNYKLTGLTELTTYEVRVLSKKGTRESDPAADSFYTLERPWVDNFNTDYTQTYVIWGPEVSTSEMTVPLADHYQLQYSTDGGHNWHDSTETLNNFSHDNAGNTNILSILLDNLTAGTDYQIEVRSVDSHGGASDWSKPKEFHAIRGPWWVDANITGLHSAHIIWDTPEAQQYELRYSSTDPTAESGTPIFTTGGSYDATGLSGLTTYYMKVRAITSYGTSDWSPVNSFYTMPGPKWVSNYNTNSTSTMLMWEDSSGISSYEVSYGVSTEPMVWTDLNLPSPTQTDYGPITGLTERTWYKARARAHVGTMASKWVYDDFFTIPVPNYVRCTGVTITSADITWNQSSLDAAGLVLCTSYEVSWGLTPEAVGSGDAVTGNLTYTLNNLITDQFYYIKVRARDDSRNGYSDWTPYPTLRVKPSNGPVIFDIDVKSGLRGTTVKITGQNFGPDMGAVMFGSTVAQPGYWTQTGDQIAVSVPPKAVAGPNTITIITATGVNATASDSFNVIDGGFVMDDFEGGVWEYTTCEAGPMNAVNKYQTYKSLAEPAPDGSNNYMTVECTGSATYEILGGVSTYGDLLTEEGYDISAFKTMTIYFKGDGTNNVATFELVESNTSPGNHTDVALATEIWKYSVPISMSIPGWQKITINLTTEGTSGKFVKDTWYEGGDGLLDLTRIKAYQILTSGGNPKKYYVDGIVAGSLLPPGQVTFNFIYNDPNINSSDNWISIPFNNPDIPNASTLASVLGLPANSVISKWDAVNQQTTTAYIVGGGAPDYAINAGDVLDVYPAGPVASYVFSGSIRASDSGLFTIAYNDPNINSSDNWIYLPPSKSSINTASALATDMALPANSVISKWDAVNQQTTSAYIVGGGAPDYAINAGDVLDVYPAGPVPIWP